MKTSAKTLIKRDNRLGEAPVWHPATRKLYWVDLYAPTLFECNIDGSGFKAREIEAPAPIGSIVATTDPNHFMIALRAGLYLLNIETMALTFYCDPEQGRSGIIPNDLKTDRWGRLWLGTSHEKELEARGALWCIKDRHTWAPADVGFPVSNGPAFSLDGRTMYFNDSADRQVLAYDVSPDHLRADNRRVFATFTADEGAPDGAAVDSEGNIWIAMWGGASVVCLSPAGQRVAQISVNAHQPTSVAFAGDHMKTLFITSARDGVPADIATALGDGGSLFAADVTIAGLNEPLFTAR